jgi:hypothetical protein
VLACAPPRVTMIVDQREVTEAQIDAVWDQLRAALTNSSMVTGFNRLELAATLRDVFNPKDASTGHVKCREPAKPL